MALGTSVPALGVALGTNVVALGVALGANVAALGTNVVAATALGANVPALAALGRALGPNVHAGSGGIVMSHMPDARTSRSWPQRKPCGPTGPEGPASVCAGVRPVATRTPAQYLSIASQTDAADIFCFLLFFFSIFFISFFDGRAQKTDPKKERSERNRP